MGTAGVWLLVRWTPSHASATGGWVGEWVCDGCNRPFGSPVDVVVHAAGEDPQSIPGAWAICDDCLDSLHGGAAVIRQAAVPCGCSGCEWARAAL